jgi:hypothetical protein
VTKRVILGRITGAQGIKGEVKLQSFTANPLDIASYGPLDASNGLRLTIKSAAQYFDRFFAVEHADPLGLNRRDPTHRPHEVDVVGLAWHGEQLHAGLFWRTAALAVVAG